MFDRFIQSLYQDPKKRLKVIVIAVLIGVSVLFFAFWSKSGAGDFNLKNFAPTTDGVSYSLQGNVVYSYNGLAFQKTALEGGASEVLAVPGRIPKPKSMSWANERGVIIEFDDSFYSTKIEDELKGLSLPIDSSTKGYIWFYDFLLDEFRILSTRSLYTDGIVVNGDESGFYYLADSTSVEFEGAGRLGPELREYVFGKPNSDELGQSRLIATDLAFTTVESIQGCSLGQGVCAVGIGSDKDSSTNESVFFVDKDGSIKLVHSAEGIVKYSGFEDWYLISGSAEDLEKNTEPQEGGFEEGPAILIDIKEKSMEINLNIDISQNIDVSFDETGALSIVFYGLGEDKSNKENIVSYFSASIDVVEHEIKSGKSRDIYTDGSGAKVYSSLGSGIKGAILLESIDESVWMLSPKASKEMALGVKGFNEVYAESTKCAAQIGGEIDESSEGKLFRVLIPTTVQYQTEFVKFSRCMEEVGSGLGYQFYFGLTLGRGGKVLTN